ncbi:aminotransferase class I/II-fold pyridoxal phosphate-dependent enzyme [Arsenicicoccus piscis]|uniref:Aminotransferase n=1 Tax=Arsenicicoccus piscis TaxID=673954 RepID=A0ABQ6HN48_9MICO|nr:aminotransferase class I/II-fold pyridoxal phosphate-dependent enzyme [Arsenicicoccus piscis]MCH8626974.1 aminotransferase class I/II-fold pyridoxal phosphate-dependent enzyme [Arsenicicoccus piscis]GMA19103.1 aminotransferase [Arsenicicoccus piscis]
MAAFGTTIFAQMSALATTTGAINLGQGFPDTDGPREVLDAAVEALRSGRNQYPPGRGVPELLSAIATHQRRFYDIELDPASDILVTVGATEAIAASVLALCGPGDEVVLFEPYYDSYAATVALAGATLRTVPLRFPDFAIDEAELRAAFSERTRMVLVNTPHNPTGKVFTAAELALIGQLAAEHGAWVVTDEVYEHLVLDGPPHVPMATLPGMAERTLTISSGGKTFSTTGWKVGWVTGPAEAISAVLAVKQFLTFVGSSTYQPAIAVGLGLPDTFYTGLRERMTEQRDLLCAGLEAAGLPIARPAAGYFVIADASPLGADAAELCRTVLPHDYGVVGVPVSVFHDDPTLAPSLVRFAFCKRPEVLEEAARRLAGGGGPGQGLEGQGNDRQGTVG